MKKSIYAAVIVLSLVCGSVLAQSNTLYQETLQIKSDDGKLIALVDMNGKTTLSKGSSYDDVINTLIIRLIDQNKQYQTQMQKVEKILEDGRNKATLTCQKAEEMYQIWNPPAPQPKPTPAPVVKITNEKKEESKKVEVKQPEKKGFWSRILGG